jgi:hypothetical protein
MDTEKLIHILQTEIQRHDFDTFIDEPPSMAQGGKGVAVVGCSACRMRFQTTRQFVEHLANDVIPMAVNKFVNL